MAMAVKPKMTVQRVMRTGVAHLAEKLFQRCRTCLP